MDAETKEFIKGEIGELATLVARGFEHTDQQFSELRTELKGDIAELRTELKGDIAELRTDVTDLRTDVDGLHQKVDALDAKVTRIDFRTQHQVDAVYEDTAKLKKDMKVAQADILELKTVRENPAF